MKTGADRADYYQFKTGMTLDEVAIVLGISRSLAQWTLNSALKKLKKNKRFIEMLKEHCEA